MMSSFLMEVFMVVDVDRKGGGGGAGHAGMGAGHKSSDFDL
jgi:hypothetical protein